MPRTSGSSLHDRFDPRANALWALRLGLAVTVAVVHTLEIGWGWQPVVGRTLLGDLAVDGFFVISGFLVTRSALRLSSLRRFTWHRSLRIMPGFWAALVVTAFIAAPILAVLRGQGVSSVLQGENSSGDFVLRNSLLLVRQWDIAGLPGDLPGPHPVNAMNGSLWTLFFEAACYALIGLVAVTALRRRRSAPTTAAASNDQQTRRTASTPYVLPALAVTMWAILGVSTTIGTSPMIDHGSRFALLFLLGAIAYRQSRTIHFTRLSVGVAMIVLALSLAVFEEFRLLGAAPFAYLIIWLMVTLPMRWTPTADLSYGMYVYHWPVALVLVELELARLGGLGLVLLSLGVSAVLASLSWYLIEGPCLRQKNAAWVERPLPRPSLVADR